MNIKKALAATGMSAAMTMSMMAGAAAPVLAVGNGEGVNVTIDAKKTTVNMTIPADAPFVFNEDGSNVTPSDFTIQNNSAIAGVHLASASLDAQSSGWQIGKSDKDYKTMPVNEKTVSLEIGETGKEKAFVPADSAEKATTGTVTFGADDFAIEASGSKVMNFKVQRGAFSEASNGTAFQMTLNFEFN